jgi:hypothetical protein
LQEGGIGFFGLKGKPALMAEIGQKIFNQILHGRRRRGGGAKDRAR